MRQARAAALGAAVLATAVLATAIGPMAAQAQQASHDELVIGVSQFPAAFHPNMDTHVVQSLVLGMTQRPFTAFDPDWQLVCMLCTEPPDLAKGTARPWTSPDGAEGLATDFAIQPNAIWGDGTPVTTEDVAFTWEVGHNPDVAAYNQDMYSRMERLEVHDDKRFTIHWSTRACDYQSAISDFKITPAHIERGIYQGSGRDYRTRSAYESDTANPGLWFGPYRVTHVEPGATIVLERYPTWWGQPGAFRRITFQTISNTAALEANLLSGTVHYIAGEDGLTLDQALQFEDRHGDAFDVVFKPGLIAEQIDLRTDRPPLDDVRVRRALLFGINRAAISERLFAGKQPVAQTILNPLHEAYFPDVPTYPHDPAQAAALLDEAGWTELRGGVRYNAAGERLSITLMTTAGNRVRELVEQVIQSDLRQIGIEVTIKNEPARVLFGETMQERRFTGMVMYANVTWPNYVPVTMFHSTMIPALANSWAGENYAGYANPAMDAALDGLRVDCEPAAQRAHWHQIQTLAATDLPVLPLYIRADPYVFPKWLKGVRPTGHGDPSTLWVEEWRVE